MGAKGKWALLVSIQEQIKSPLSRAYSKCLFYLFRVYCPPTAVFRPSKREAALCLLMSAKLTFLLTQRAVRNQTSWPMYSHKTKPHAVCSRTQTKESIQPSLWSQCCQPLDSGDS